ncbi:hypothetical protein [Pararcticibacter amylolyticus]|nr:hypothetical protein [Pararcticibacter amylolyticus]
MCVTYRFTKRDPIYATTITAAGTMPAPAIMGKEVITDRVNGKNHTHIEEEGDINVVLNRQSGSFNGVIAAASCSFQISVVYSVYVRHLVRSVILRKEDEKKYLLLHSFHKISSFGKQSSFK